MLKQFKQAYDSSLEEEHSLSEHVALYLESFQIISREDLVWIWELLVINRETIRNANGNDAVSNMNTPLSRQSTPIQDMLHPLRWSSAHGDMEHFHGLPSVCNVLLDVCFTTKAAQKVLSVLLEKLLPEYHDASMSGFRVDWRVVDMTLTRYDPSLSRHLAEFNVSIEILCSQWFFSLFADVMHVSVIHQFYTWVLVSSKGKNSKKHSNLLVTMALAILFYLSDVLQDAEDASSIKTLIDHFCHDILQDEEMALLFLEWCHRLHVHFDDTIESCRNEVQIEENTIPRRIFVGWRQSIDSTSSNTKEIETISPRQSDWPELIRKHMGHQEISYEEYQQLPMIALDIEDAIDKDIKRTSNACESTWDALRRVLITFSKRNPTIGYCQGMNEIAGVLLHEISEVDSFWGLVYLIEQVFPNYHNATVIGIHTDCAVIETLLYQNDPHLIQHLNSLGLNMEILCTSWLMACYTTTTPSFFYLDLLDRIFHGSNPKEGSRLVLITALSILLYLSSILIYQIEPSGIFNKIKYFLNNNIKNLIGFITTLIHQFSLNEMEQYRLIYVQKKLNQLNKNKKLNKLNLFSTKNKNELNLHLNQTMELYQQDTIDSNEYVYIKKQIIRTWSTSIHTLIHGQNRIKILNSIFFSINQTQKQSLYTRQRAKARASFHAISSKFRTRSNRKEKIISSTGLELNEIATSYYGGEINQDQRIARKSEMIAKTLFQ